MDKRALRTPPVFIDAAHFDPHCKTAGGVLVIFARNEASRISQRVIRGFQCAEAVIVIDEGSTDGTPYRAAEAGAVVIIMSARQSREDAVQEAREIAGRMGGLLRIENEYPWG